MKNFFKKTVDKFRSSDIISTVKQNQGGVMVNKYSQYVYTEELKRERKNKGLSIVDMAKLLGFKSKVTYYNIENGISEPKISNINNISKILGKSPKKFFNFKVQQN